MANVNRRLARGGRIDRTRPLRFWFNGRELTGFGGDTLASALMANGIDIMARSFKLRRPRGLIASGASEPNALLQVDRGGRSRPVQRATQTELHYDLEARMVNVWPSADYNLSGAMGLVGRFLPAGFYYKTFMRPAGFWTRYEQVIRRGAGLGHAPDARDPDRYDKRFAHCDVLVVGAGPAGLAAALAAARGGARVIVADEEPEFGGSLLADDESINNAPAMAWVADTIAELRACPEVTLLPRATVYGYYDHNWLGIHENRTDHLPPDQRDDPRQRLWKVRAGQVICATGALERPLVFANNDRPGVMLASAAATYINRYAVMPGQRAVVFTNNDTAYRAALVLWAAGIDVAAIVDTRAAPGEYWQKRARAAGLRVRTAAVVFDVRGKRRVRAACVAGLSAGRDGLCGPRELIDCDLVAVSGGWNPVVHLHSQSGARPRFDSDISSFVPGESVQPESSVGAANATFDLGAALVEGFAAGAQAAADRGFTPGTAPPFVTEAVAEAPIEALWRVPHNKRCENAPKQFVDYQNDVTAADLRLALRENYQHIEHIKRYTALGFGTDQGKLGNINGMGIVADERGVDPQQVGTTTFRPAYTPVSFGAIAGCDVGALLDPARKTPMHAWHVAAGAVFEDVGQWKRARYYPRAGESMAEALDRECLATHDSVGVLDYSTLGKIDVKGPDAANFLDRIYVNNWQKLKVGGCRYGLMLREDGSILDDGVTARLADDHFLVHTSTGGAAPVLAWMEDWLQTEWPDMRVYLTSLTDHLSTIAVAGPGSRRLCEHICDDIDLSAEAFPFFAWRSGTVAGVAARVMRVSFSGELTYEISVVSHHARHVWDAVMAAGRPYNATPYGTETMHVLRAEKGFVIVGQDTDATVVPDDLGLTGLLSTKKDFLGRRGLAMAEASRAGRAQLVGLRSEHDSAVIPEGAQLVVDPDAARPVPMIGHVTSAYYSARCGYPIALALVENGRERMDEIVYATSADGPAIAARITSTMFFDVDGARQHV